SGGNKHSLLPVLQDLRDPAINKMRNEDVIVGVNRKIVDAWSDFSNSSFSAALDVEFRNLTAAGLGGGKHSLLIEFDRCGNCQPRYKSFRRSSRQRNTPDFTRGNCWIIEIAVWPDR